MGGGSGLARSSEAGVSREDRQGEEGAGGRRRAASGSDESVAAAFRLPPALCRRGVGLGHLCAAAALPYYWLCVGCAAEQLASTLVCTKTLIFIFSHQHPIPTDPVLSRAVHFLSRSLPSGQPMPLPAPKRLSLHSGCVLRVDLLTLTQASIPT